MYPEVFIALYSVAPVTSSSVSPTLYDVRALMCCEKPCRNHPIGAWTIKRKKAMSSVLVKPTIERLRADCCGVSPDATVAV